MVQISLIFKAANGACLWIGSEEAAKDRDGLNAREITHILCIGSEPFHPHSFDYANYPYILDIPTENLLKILDSSCNFVEEGMNNKKNTLVHCVYGQSRSAAVVTAYIMRTTGGSLADVKQLISNARPEIFINEGFIAQLELYWQLLYGDIDDKITAAATIRWWQFAHGENIIPKLAVNSSPYYFCRKCRYKLFSSSSIIDHKHPVVKLMNTTSNKKKYEFSKQHQNNLCTSLFIEPLPWCSSTKSYSCQKFECPGGCGSKLGSKDSVSGLTCSCGCTVCPAFQIQCSKIERR